MAAKAADLVKQLRAAALKQPSPDVSTATTLLSKIKIEIMENFKSLPGMTPAAEANQEELLVIRETYELACLVMVEQKDIPGFERHMSLAKTCYTDYKTVLPQSEYQHQLQGLNLLCLLAQSKIAEFHTELELIPVDLWEKNEFIKFPIKLEQYLMEGSYPKVLTSVDKVPAPSFHYFVSMLSDTVRDSIAESSEAAYESLPLDEALKMLKISTVAELEDYATMRERGWDVDKAAKLVRFREEHKVDLEVPSQRLIIETLSYAKELERIV